MEQGGRLVVMGQGYVGLPLAVRAVEVGWHVVGLEIDEARASRLAAAESYIEDVTDGTLAAALATGRYEPVSSPDHLDGLDVAVITVPTPLRDGAPDLSFIKRAGHALAPHLRAGATVILESTTYPGTTEDLLAPLLRAGSGLVAGEDFHLGYSPERIDPGNPVWGLINTPKVVSGVDPRSLVAVRAFYDTLVERTVPVSSTRTAELAKLLENTFRHVNIALVNELAMCAHQLGVDVWEAIDAAASKPFGFMRFEPGPGVGGHCLPIDPSYLSWRVQRSLGRSFRFVELANDINSHMPDHVVRRAIDVLNDRGKAVRGSRVLLLGLAYKKNSRDARESPAVRVATLLVELGARVRAVDPHVTDPRLPPGVQLIGLDDLGPAELAAADLVVILADHDLFDRDMVARHASAVLDTRHCLTPDPSIPTQRLGTGRHTPGTGPLSVGSALAAAGAPSSAAGVASSAGSPSSAGVAPPGGPARAVEYL